MEVKYTYIKLFRNPALLAEMLELKANGATNKSLARRYNCARSAIIWRCKSDNVKQVTKKLMKAKKGDISRDEIKNKGHRYSYYLAKSREERRLEEELISRIISQLDE